MTTSISGTRGRGKTDNVVCTLCSFISNWQHVNEGKTVRKCCFLDPQGLKRKWLTCRHIYKGCSNKNVLAQNLKVAFWQEPFVRGGCPSHSLEYSWVLQAVRSTTSSDKWFLSNTTFKFWARTFLFEHPLYANCPVFISTYCRLCNSSPYDL